MGKVFKTVVAVRKMLEGLHKLLGGSKTYFEVIAAGVGTAAAIAGVVLQIPSLTGIIPAAMIAIIFLKHLCRYLIDCLKTRPVGDSGATRSNRIRVIIASLFVVTNGILKIKLKRSPYGTHILPATSAEDVAKISKINTERFSNSENFSADYDQKYKRNLAMWDRNSRVFMTVRNSGKLYRVLSDENGENDVLFFSHLIPLNQTGFNEYFIERIAGDRDFRDYWVATSDEKTVALLAFTIAAEASLVEDHRQGLSWTLWVNYINCMHAHIYDLLSNAIFDGDSLPVYLQTDDDSIVKIADLMKMSKTAYQTKDRADVYKTNVALLTPES
ncbi:hypothetical protein Q1W73_13540 [Asticcacaulis sp. ZE23SCel15]|uniref:hypothetical protein n=1 Tax=Asticcacaulis sp. ZE23SCel15 TaxID=3059027 RepID=UPI00265E643B|nr:hypothetical protein [Asticcacaulis sp. ZE23SCel15]WKL56683.1 hypothetical protein Q1W73_13540 [Asticcacaulis sp. ZE23SCel15]